MREMSSLPYYLTHSCEEKEEIQTFPRIFVGKRMQVLIGISTQHTTPNMHFQWLKTSTIETFLLFLYCTIYPNGILWNKSCLIICCKIWQILLRLGETPNWLIAQHLQGVTDRKRTRDNRRNCHGANFTRHQVLPTTHLLTAGFLVTFIDRKQMTKIQIICREVCIWTC